MATSVDPLDAPYDAEVLALIRSTLHRKIVAKVNAAITKSDYMIYFNEDMPSDILWTAGKPIRITLGCSPFDGERVTSLVKRAFGMPSKKIVRELLRTTQSNLVRQSDAMLWYGVELSGIRGYTEEMRKKLDNKRWVCEELFNFHKIQVTDVYTGKSVILEAKNTNVFDLQAEAIKLLMKE